LKYPEELIKYHENMTDDELVTLARQLRRDALGISNCSGTRSGHMGGHMSVAEIIAVLYGRHLRIGLDRAVLSKGHNSSTLYAALAFRGYFEREVLFTQMNHVDGLLQDQGSIAIPGIEAPSGSLGMGLGVCTGFAWSARYDKTGARAYAVLGDGECTEGEVWETAMYAAGAKLDNLIAIVDNNGYVISGKVSDITGFEPFAAKWAAFGWDVQEVDGQSITELTAALAKAEDPAYAVGKPRVIIAHTTKGYPLSRMMADPVNFHSAHLTDELYEEFLKEI